MESVGKMEEGTVRSGWAEEWLLIATGMEGEHIVALNIWDVCKFVNLEKGRFQRFRIGIDSRMID